MLSLAKLSALASGSDDGEGEETTAPAAAANLVDSVEHQLWAVAAQEGLPRSALEAYGIDREAMRVLTPREVIEVRRLRNHPLAYLSLCSPYPTTNGGHPEWQHTLHTRCFCTFWRRFAGSVGAH